MKLKLITIVLLFALSCGSNKQLQQSKLLTTTAEKEAILEKNIFSRSFEFKDTGKITILQDTNILIKPFCAEAEKSIEQNGKKSTIFIKYNQPSNLFDVKYDTVNDTIITSIIKDTITVEVEKNVTSWYIVGLGLVALIILLIFLLKK